MQKSKEKILEFIQQLINEGKALQESRFRVETNSFSGDEFVPVQAYAKWCGSCRLLLKKLGGCSKPWKKVLNEIDGSNSTTKVEMMIGALESIEESVKQGRLKKFGDAISSEPFANFIEQGEHLMKKKCYHSAAVTFRAVLEESLRRLCEGKKELAFKKRPTLSEYANALHQAQIFDKEVLKQVQGMITTGNAAASEKKEVEPEKVKQFHQNLLDFLKRFSMA